MTLRATLIASIADRDQLENLRETARDADILEIRADLVGEVDVDWLREEFDGALMYTLRSSMEGGRADEPGPERHRRLASVARRFDLIDLEAERDLDSDLLEQIPADRRVISWHGDAEASDSLRRRLAEMRSITARWYKIVPQARRAGDEFGPLVMTAGTRAGDVIAFSAGEIGRWTRVLAPRLGAPVVYAALPGAPAAPGQITLKRWIEDYGLPRISPVEELFGIVGHPVAHSLSPRLHNLGYRVHNLPFAYVPFEAPSFADFWLEVGESGRLEFLGFPLGGLSVTAPHKQTAAAIAGALSPVADRLNSVNTLVRRGEVWEGQTTDHDGVLEPLRRLGVSLHGAAAAVVGAGGAGRVACWALRREGARVTLVSRNAETGAATAEDLGVGYVALPEFRPREFAVIVHATPLGRDRGDVSPIDIAALDEEATLLDLVYLPDAPTAMVREARARGLAAIDGREVLLAQAMSQFRLMTRRELPEIAAREALGLEEPS